MAHFVALVVSGVSKSGAAREAGIGLATMNRQLNDPLSAIMAGLVGAGLAVGVPGRESYSPDALRALDDFGFFREYFFARSTNPWAEEAAYKMLELAATPREEYVVVNLPPGAGKALALDTLIATPSGWTTQGGIRVGDELFDENGEVCRVVAKSEIFYGHDCYEVKTDDGSSVIANAAHEWSVRLDGLGQYKAICKPDYVGKTGPKPSKDGRHVHTSEFLAKSRTKRPQLQMASALNTPDVELPIDPYVLGVWLGDGIAAGSRLTIHPDDAPHIVKRVEDAGYRVERKAYMRYSVTGSKLWARDGLTTHLRKAGLLGAKTVPSEFLRGSIRQRLALLQGLIDSDGHVSNKGAIEFRNTNKNLALSVQHLVHSLGAKASLTESRATLYGKDCGTKYRVTFYLKDAASLPRKAVNTKNGIRTPSRYLTATPTNSVPTQCIQVDSPSHLYLAGRGLMVTHNSTIFTHDLLAWMACRDRGLSQMIGSASQNLANGYTNRLRNTFERTTPVRANAKLLELGRAKDAKSTLARSYGRFKPLDQGQWSRNAFDIAQLDGSKRGEKESSFVGYGMDAGFLGGRFDRVVWDDLVTGKTIATDAARIKLETDWENESETRLEPEGLLILQGQRLGPTDLYRYCVSEDSLISTERGDVPIRDVHVGDQVWTREGLREVEWSGCTGVRETVTIKTASGLTLSLTPDHKIATPDGWKEAGLFASGDTLLAISRNSEFTLVGVPKIGFRVFADSTSPSNNLAFASDRDDVIPFVGMPFRTMSPAGKSLRSRTPVKIAPVILINKMLRIQAERVMAKMGSLILQLLAPFMKVADNNSGNKLLAGKSPMRGSRVALRINRLSFPNKTLAFPLTSRHKPFPSKGSALENAIAGSASAIPAFDGSAAVDTVVSITHNGMVRVWDLTVNATHEFYANGILVHNCLNLKEYTELDMPDEGTDTARKYHHIKFKAHYEDRCENDHGLDAKPYPEGCLLDPYRLNWRKLMNSKLNKESSFRTVYQQEDVDTESALVKEIWINGGIDPETGVLHQGCWDTERKIGQLKDLVNVDGYSVVTVDPSPTKYWACMWWLYSPKDQMYYLLDMIRSPLEAPDFLDYNISSGKFSGILEEWTQRATNLGRPITDLIMESNAAQKFMNQYNYWKVWQAKNGIDITPHQTNNSNKTDEEYGVQTIAPHFRHGRVRLPGHRESGSRQAVSQFVKELTEYSSGKKSGTDDTVMSFWFLVWNAPNLFDSLNLPVYQMDRPSWMLERA